MAGIDMQVAALHSDHNRQVPLYHQWSNPSNYLQRRGNLDSCIFKDGFCFLLAMLLDHKKGLGGVDDIPITRTKLLQLIPPFLEGNDGTFSSGAISIPNLVSNML